MTSRSIPQDVFVFGSNLAGIHGKGAALFASRHFEAKRGIGEGLTGFSYALPTKDERLLVLPIEEIAVSAERFLRFAESNKQYRFQLTPVGTGLAGYSDDAMSGLFVEFPGNVGIPGRWHQLRSPVWRIVVAGSRSFTDTERLGRILDICMERSKGNLEVVCGEARGADSLGKEWALSRGCPVCSFPAEWGRLGRRAGVVRNWLMANYATHAVLFWDGASPGTANMRGICEELRVRTAVYEF